MILSVCVFSQDNILRQSCTIHLHMCFEVFFQLTHANVVRKSVWIHPQVNSFAVDSIFFKKLRARPVVSGSHLLCDLRQFSKPQSLLAHVTTSKLSPSARADSTLKSCPSMSADVSSSSSGTPIATAVAVISPVTPQRMPKLHARSGTHLTRGSQLFCPHAEVFSFA